MRKCMKNDSSSGFFSAHAPRTTTQFTFSSCKVAGEKSLRIEHSKCTPVCTQFTKSCYFVENWLLCECFYCRHYRNVLIFRGALTPNWLLCFVYISMHCIPQWRGLLHVISSRSLKMVPEIKFKLSLQTVRRHTRQPNGNEVDDRDKNQIVCLLKWR